MVWCAHQSVAVGMNSQKVTPTPFQQRVYKCLKRVERGKFTTYQELAKAVHCPSPRAVAGALKRNPYAPNIPCHRVLSSSYHIGGYKGSKDATSTFVQQKIKLLESEGILFDKENFVIQDQRKACFMKLSSE